jgi:hypothetical protein
MYLYVVSLRNSLAALYVSHIMRPAVTSLSLIPLGTLVRLGGWVRGNGLGKRIICRYVYTQASFALKNIFVNVSIQ